MMIEGMTEDIIQTAFLIDGRMENMIPIRDRIEGTFEDVLGRSLSELVQGLSDF